MLVGRNGLGHGGGWSRGGSSSLIVEYRRIGRAEVVWVLSDAHFLLGLEKAGVDFVAADMPNANRLTVGIMAMVAEGLVVVWLTPKVLAS
jgi:hypothetical protein